MAVERYYSCCELGEGNAGGSAASTTTSGDFDSAFFRGCVSVPDLSSYFETPVFVDAANPTDIYMHAFFITPATGGTLTNGASFFEAINSTGTVVFRLRNASASGPPYTLQAEYWNGSTYTAVGSTFQTTGTTRQQLDIHLVCGGSGRCDVWINKGLVASTSSMSASTNNVAKVRHRHFWGSGRTAWSGMAGANFDLRDLNIKVTPATGNGTNTAWSGAFGDIDEINVDDTDLISGSASGDKESYTKGSYTLPNGTVLDSVWIAGRGRIGASGPTDAYFIVRSGGANYHIGTALDLNGGFEPRARYTATDPATSAQMTNANFNSLEFGVEAA